MVRHATLAFALATATTIAAQYSRPLSANIASVQTVVGNRWLSLPIAELNGSEAVNISFDDLTHEYHRYCYRLEHCEADWTTSEQLFGSDYCNGFVRDILIDDMEESINTNILYTHYSIQIPNQLCRPKISGNYRLTIYDDDNGRDVAEACFMLVQPLMSISMEATTNTDIDIRGTHQQIGMTLDYGTQRVTNRERELTVVVMQNGRRDNAVINPRPQFITPTSLKWQHNRELIFLGGNEYRKFETLDVTHTTMGLEAVGWSDDDYHAYVWPDEPRPHYVYDEDANGYFYIRNSDNIDNDVASEYLLVHFRLTTDRPHADIFLSGKWTAGQLTEQYRMHYDEETQTYNSTQVLKQGYYSYQYLLLNSDGTVQTLPSEGNFYNTENQYQCLVYYRPIGQRTDQLVGYSQVQLQPNGR